ncbi:Hemolysin, contains CBS domains [Bowdeniella nasicola]|uniref:Hemolysin, contains CBS domains n=1 Tax=Bowdeniella nasicola TaxID=208480 RepID=A0A1H3VR83_9ACTO|nr:hemolysin family protein [Bowdeniella nasicola]SDZ76632.1 Hemolysin, contains CBS domains [Bowdeniella nasicola]
MSATTALIIGLILLALNAFFVGAEFAIMSVRRSQMEPLVESGRAGARTVMWALEHVTDMLATAQLGITICSTGIGAVAEPAVAKLVEGPLMSMGLPAQASHVVGFTVALTIVIYLHVVVGEMVPKNLAIASPETAALIFGPPLVWISKPIHPILVALNGIANIVLKLFGVEPKREVAAAFTAEEVASIVERSQAEGVLEDDLGLLSGAIEFSEENAVDVMVPTDDLVTITRGATPADVEADVTRTGFSRFPVLDDSGGLIGYVHVKDVLYAEGHERHRPIASWRIRALARVRPGDQVEEALRTMQVTGAHLARVDDEDGQSIGVVFLEDILEELVGEVRDVMQREPHRYAEDG